MAGNALSMRIGPLAESPGPLSHWHYDSFRWVAGDNRYGESIVQFEADESGAIKALTWNDGALRFQRAPAETKATKAN